MSKMEEVRLSEINLMRQRINDLTVKLTSSERTLRQTQIRFNRSQAKLQSSSTKVDVERDRMEETADTPASYQTAMNKDDNDREVQNDKNASSHDIGVMHDTFDVIEHPFLLSRLSDLSTSVRKISNSLSSYCDITSSSHLSFLKDSSQQKDAHPTTITTGVSTDSQQL